MESQWGHGWPAIWKEEWMDQKVLVWLCHFQPVVGTITRTFPMGIELGPLDPHAGRAKFIPWSEIAYIEKKGDDERT